jgi:hypothetical protein
MKEAYLEPAEIPQGILASVYHSHDEGRRVQLFCLACDLSISFAFLRLSCCQSDKMSVISKRAVICLL